jgi:hypothetical protein
MVPMDLIGIRVINIIPFITNIFHIVHVVPMDLIGYFIIINGKWIYIPMDIIPWIMMNGYLLDSSNGYFIINHSAIGDTMETLSRPPLRNLVR